MKKRISLLLATIFILATIVIAVVHNLGMRRILILHSYDAEYSWSRDVNVGLKRVLDDNPQWLVRWHYMDLKRRPWPDYRNAAGQQAQRVIEEWKPDVVIAIDDDAQSLVAMKYAGDPNIKIVFAGVNGWVSDYGYDNVRNVTGIFERKQLGAVRDAILAGYPKGGTKKLRLLHLGDQSHSVSLDDAFIRSFNWQPLQYTGTQLVSTYPEWQAVVKAAKDKTDVLLLTNYRRLARSETDRTLVPAHEVVAWTENNSPVPLIGTNGFYVEDGGMLAIGTSGYEQGEVAAQMATRIIKNGVEPASISTETTSEFVIFMRQNRMEQHNFSLPKLYEAFARATNNYFD